MKSESFTAGGRRVFVLMSGGVDSSAAALMLMRGGWRVTGVTMEHIARGSSAAAARVCAALGIEHMAFDFVERFERGVVACFRDAYASGNTPNPCILCNARMKFGALWDEIKKIYPGEDFYVATGHYARVVECGGARAIFRGADRSKDQSYFLCMIEPSRLDRLLFPLGGYTKNEIRALARDAGLAVADEPDSMEICFAGSEGYKGKLAASSGAGPIYDLSGALLGEHKGIESFTIGQRKGLGISSRDGLFVVAIDAGKNAVIVGSREDAFVDVVRAVDMNIFSGIVLEEGMALSGKVRSQGEPVACVLSSVSFGFVEAAFSKKISIPAPGQFMALYDGERLVAGGVIAASRRTA